MQTRITWECGKCGECVTIAFDHLLPIAVRETAAGARDTRDRDDRVMVQTVGRYFHDRYGPCIPKVSD